MQIADYTRVRTWRGLWGGMVSSRRLGTAAGPDKARGADMQSGMIYEHSPVVDQTVGRTGASSKHRDGPIWYVALE